MKKIISLVLTAAMILSVTPTLVWAEATDPEGTVYVYNTLSDGKAADGTEADGFSHTPVAAGSTSTLVESRMTTAGYNNTTPVAFGNNYNATAITYTPTLEKAGLYEVYFWNVCVIDETETFQNTEDDPPPLSKNVTYTVTTVPKGSSTECISKHDFTPATASGGVNGWVSLGRFYFSAVGDGKEKISVNKFSAEDDYLYLSALKFVPVSAAADPVGLERVYATKYGTASTDDWTSYGANARSTAADAKDGNVTVSDIGQQQVVLTAIATDPNATVRFGNAAENPGRNSVTYSANNNNFFTEDETIKTAWITVTPADGGTPKTYPVTIEYENEAPTVLTTENSDKTGTAAVKHTLKGHAMYDYANRFVYASTTVGETITYSPDLTTAGYYNVYAYNTATFGKTTAREVLATVTHNGIREQAIIPFGGAVEGDWSSIGKFYFAGGDDEKITLSNIVSSADITNFVDIKLAPAAENPQDKELRGISVTANGETHSVLEESADGYIMPLPAGTYTTAAVMVDAGSDVTDITINGTAATANTASEVAISDKDNYVTVAVTTASGTTEYTLNLYKQMKPYKIGNNSAAQGDPDSVYYNVSNIGKTIKLPLDIDGAGDSLYKIEANATTTPKWTPHIEEAFGTENTAYHVLFWKPVLGSVNGGEDVYGSSDLDITINAGGTNYYETVDCTSGTSEWVNLGTYKIKPEHANLSVSLEANLPEHLLVDQYGIIFLQTDMSAGISRIIFNNELNYTKEQLDGAEIKSEALKNIRFELWNATDKLYINGEEWAANTPYSPSYTPGINRFEIVVKDADGNIEDTCSFKVLSEAYTREAENAEQTGTWAAATDYTGVNGTTVYSNAEAGDSLKYTVSGNSKGTADVYVYRHLGTAALTGTATVSIGDTTLGTVSNDASTSAGWVKVGSYDFKGGEDITLTVTSGTILADAVKIVYTGTMYSSPVLVETETGYKAVADVYQTTNENVSAALYLAKYTNDGTLVSIKKAPLTLNGEGTDSADTEVVSKGSGRYRAFLWSNSDKITPLAPDAGITVADEADNEPVEE